MGGLWSILRDFKRHSRSTLDPVPDIVGAGPILDGNPPIHKDVGLPLDTNSDVYTILDSLKNNGADFFKVYSLLQESELKQIATYCRTENLTFAGHLSEYVQPERSIELGQKSVEHLNRLDDIWLQDKNRMEKIAMAMQERSVWLCPTIVTYWLKVHMIDSTAYSPTLEQYIHPALKAEWTSARKSREKRFSDSNELQKQKSLLTEQMHLIKFLHEKNVKLLAGSDFAGMPFVYPGLGLHQELELMVECGVPAKDALQSATINPALFFGIENNYGTVDAGKYADLVILNSNPLINIKNTQSIFAVYKKGESLMNDSK